MPVMKRFLCLSAKNLIVASRVVVLPVFLAVPANPKTLMQFIHHFRDIIGLPDTGQAGN